jgi:hypothetical protein
MRALYRVRACVRYARQVIQMLNSVVLFATAQYIPIEQLHRRRCYQKPCATTKLCLRSLLHVRLHLPRTLCSYILYTSVRSALLIVRFSHQQRLRVDLIHTSKSTDAVGFPCRLYTVKQVVKQVEMQQAR